MPRLLERALAPEHDDGCSAQPTGSRPLATKRARGRDDNGLEKADRGVVPRQAWLQTQDHVAGVAQIPMLRERPRRSSQRGEA